MAGKSFKSVTVGIFRVLEKISRTCITIFVLAVLVSMVLVPIITGLIIASVDSSRHASSGVFTFKESRRPNVVIFDPVQPLEDVYARSRGIGAKIVRKLDLADISDDSLQEYIAALEKATTDDRVDGIILYMDQTFFLNNYQERVMNVVKKFKETGKSIVVFDKFNYGTLMVSSLTDDFIVDGLDTLRLIGTSTGNLYYRGFFDKFGIEPLVTSYGKYKSAFEVYERDSVSEPVRENQQDLFGGMWTRILENAARNWGIPTSDIQSYVDNYDGLFKRYEGDMPRAAMDRGMITGIYTGGESLGDFLMGRMEKILGTDSLKFANYRSYIDGDFSPYNSKKNFNIAVVPLVGGLIDGHSTLGAMGDETIVPFIRDLNDTLSDEDALVLYINSPGGSAAAAARIHREIMTLKNNLGIPIVVFMSSLAASGGYYLSTASDYIFAEPMTITGSIGVVAMDFSINPLLQSLGINFDGRSDTWLDDSREIRAPASERKLSLQQLETDTVYTEFITLVARARGMSIEDADAVAQGRVYTGAQALGAGLVDELGDLDDAVAKAAEMAGLEESRVSFFFPPLDESITDIVPALASRMKDRLGTILKSSRTGLQMRYIP